MFTDDDGDDDVVNYRIATPDYHHNFDADNDVDYDADYDADEYENYDDVNDDLYSLIMYLCYLLVLHMP